MHCEEALERMSAALDGELSPRERAELDAHLADCPDCAALFAELAGQSAVLRGLDCEVPADLSRRILAGLPEQQGKRAAVIRLRRWGALAACLVLVAVGGAAMRGTFAPKADSALARDTAVSYSVSVASDATAVAEFSIEETTEETADMAEVTAQSDISGPAISAVRYLRTDWLDRGESSARLISSPEEMAALAAEHPNLAEELPQYSAEFFDGTALIAVVLEENSGSVSHTVESVLPWGDGWEIRISRQVPEAGTCDMAGWLILIETDPVFSPGDQLSVTLF